MQTYLDQLKPGTRFRLVGMPEITGELIACTDCSAAVRLDCGVRDVEFDDEHGEPRTFRARRVTTTRWASATVVEPIYTTEGAAPSHHEEIDMSAKKTTTTKAKAPKATNKATKPLEAKVTKATKPAKKALLSKAHSANGKTSALDAAAKVLAEAKQPMAAKEMIDAMAAKGYWTSPGGKTPHATLYSAILREIKAKGKQARFKKTDRGQFAINNA